MTTNDLDNLPALNLSGILYGGDYNPEQWAESVWDEDVRFMGDANWNIATLPVFGWVSLEPEEGTFTFEWLDRILDKLHRGGVRVCLATATASVPAWLDQKYPDVLVTQDNGVKARHGNRHTFCPNSANFRRLSTKLVRAIGERYKDHPAVALWHVGNEYGTHCFCEQNCAPAFRDWLREKYGSLDELNRVWYTRFWGHTFTDWSQIEPAYANGERSMNALRLDYARFQSDSLLNCFRAEKAVLREITPTIPVTTNLMGTFFPLNYREWAKEMDIVSWDNYPGPNAPPAHIAFSHAVMRGLKEGQPFLLMEQSPSQQNWQPYNAIKPPKQLRLQSFQAVAQGADSVMYFQWRRGRGGIEKLHGAVMEHHGRTDGRVFNDVAELGADLQRLGGETIGGRIPAQVAVLFDWENWWNLRFGSGPSVDLNYSNVVRDVYSALFELGIQTEVVCPDADLSRFDLVIAPTLTLIRKADGERLQDYVRNGGTLLATAFTGLVDDTDLVYENGAPGLLTEVLGLWTEETDALPKGKTNGIRFGAGFDTIEPGSTFGATILCDRIRPGTAEIIATYTDDFYAGEPVFTVNRYGKGTGYYLATIPEETGYMAVLSAVCRKLGIGSPLSAGAAPPSGVEVTQRVSPSRADVLYLLNHGAASQTVRLPPDVIYTDLLSGDTVHGEATLGVRDVRVLRKQSL
ncbi:MAG: beta-galactosidase [Akkermansiaceae bacterium]|nr:beta-galactosidase [Armatimonadota bacterium]